MTGMLTVTASTATRQGAVALLYIPPKRVVIFTDGAKTDRAACGAVVITENGEAIEILSRLDSTCSCNEAEYAGLIEGLEFALDASVTIADVWMDSQLVVNQVNGRWKVRADNLRDYHRHARSLVGRFEQCRVRWRSRDFNEAADGLAAEALTIDRVRQFRRRQATQWETSHFDQWSAT